MPGYCDLLFLDTSRLSSCGENGVGKVKPKLNSGIKTRPHHSNPRKTQSLPMNFYLLPRREDF